MLPLLLGILAAGISLSPDAVKGIKSLGRLTVKQSVPQRGNQSFKSQPIMDGQATFEPDSTNARKLTVPEAAARLGLSIYTTRKKIRDGELKAVKENKNYMIPEREVIRYIQKTGKAGISQIVNPMNSAIELENSLAENPELIRSMIEYGQAKLESLDLEIEIAQNQVKSKEEQCKKRPDNLVLQTSFQQDKNNLLLLRKERSDMNLNLKQLKLQAEFFKMDSDHKQQILELLNQDLIQNDTDGDEANDILPVTQS